MAFLALQRSKNQIKDNYNVLQPLIIIENNQLARMGNHESWDIFGKVRTWKQLAGKRVEITGTPSLVQDENSLLVADCYEIPLLQNFNYQHKMMIKHQNLDDPSISKLIDARIKEKTILECGTLDVIQIFTEALSCRFDQICLNDSENLFVIHQVLRGCQLLMSLIGNYFTITAKKISFTQNGRVKIWFNESFGRYDLDQNNLLRSQQEMIRGIFAQFAYKFSRRYDFFQATTFSQAIFAVQNILNPFDKQLIQLQIQNKLKRMKTLQTPISFKKLSVSDKSINEGKPKSAMHHRQSIEYSLQKANNMKHSRVPESKQNQVSLKFMNTSNIIHINQPPLKSKKIVEDDMKVLAKISLADTYMNSSFSMFSTFSSGFAPRMSVPCSKKPMIKINYESHQKRQQFQNLSNVVENLTIFPKQGVQPASLTTNPIKKTSLLRRNFRKCSEIPERSQAAENTSCQISEIDHANDLTQNEIWQNENWNLLGQYESSVPLKM